MDFAFTEPFGGVGGGVESVQDLAAGSLQVHLLSGGLSGPWGLVLTASPRPLLYSRQISMTAPAVYTG